MFVPMRAVWFAVCSGLAACDPEAKLCHERMSAAQAIVTQVDGKSLSSVEQSLAAVTQAHSACDKAKLGTEREQLLKAKNELSAQKALLEQREQRRKQRAPTRQELAELIKAGDPSCPKGQAYKPKDSKSEVRCTGPQLVDMPRAALKEYYGERRFKLVASESPLELRAELGSEKYVFGFDTAEGAPRCVTAYAAPGVSWQEITARLTGVAPEKLKLGIPVKSTRELALRVEHETDQPTIHLGDCGQIVAPP